MLAAHNNIHLPFHRIAFRKSVILYTISLSLPFHCFLILPFHSSTSILSEHARLPPTTNCPIQSSAILYAFFISSSSPNPQAFPPAIEHMYGLFVRNFADSVVCLISPGSQAYPFSLLPSPLLSLPVLFLEEIQILLPPLPSPLPQTPSRSLARVKDSRRYPPSTTH